MTVPAGLDHIAEGVAYKDGEARQLYAADNAAAAQAALFQKSIDYNYSFGPLTLHTHLDTTGPSVSVKATLLGTTLSLCELSTAHQDCKIGGSVDGFTAKIDLTLKVNPLQLAINGQLSVPIHGSKTFATTIPL